MIRRILIGSVVLLAILGCSGGPELVVSQAEEDVTYKASDVSRTHEVGPVYATLEEWGFKKGFDGAYELSYSYQKMDDPILAIVDEITVDNTEGDAKTSYKALKLGASIGMAGDLEKILRNDLLTWGDEHECAILKNDAGFEVGNYCVIRDGRVTYLWMVVGILFTEPDEITMALRPQLEALATYNPSLTAQEKVEVP
jgi:hypothetical protein